MDQKRLRENRCLVCESNNLEPLLFYYSQYLPKFFHRVAICKDCGHIQVYPLFEPIALEQINTRFFGSTYMVEDQQNLANNTEKLRKLDERLAGHLKDLRDILDVGAGEAWAMDYFRSKNCNYFAIEYVPRLAGLIQERGGTVIGQTIFDDYSDYASRFDLIIFRHILEHLLDPREALSKLSQMLRPGGLIYLALPNAENPSINVGFKNLHQKGFRTSFIRPIHISYFCEGNVHRLAQAAGLAPVLSEAEGEIFCLLKRSDESDLHSQNFYPQQKEIFLSAGRKTLVSDILKICRNLPRALGRRVLLSDL